MIGYVYKVTCPITLHIIYVGSTTTSLEQRIGEHFRDSKWMEKYLRKSNGVKPIIEIIEEVSFYKSSRLLKRERHYIKLYQTEFLLNKNHLQKDDKVLIKVKESVKNRVCRAIVGTDYTISSFYDEAAEEKLSKKPKK